jgi:hypothetical protein
MAFELFRFRAENRLLAIFVGDRLLGEAELHLAGTRVGLFAAGPAAFDAARVTGLNALRLEEEPCPR